MKEEFRDRPKDKNVAAIILVAVMVSMLFLGCRGKYPRSMWEPENIYLGSFVPCETATGIDTQFELPERLDVARLVLVTTETYGGIHLLTNVAALRFRLTLSSPSATAPFFDEAITMQEHTLQCNWFSPKSALLVTGIEPFNYPSSGVQAYENTGLSPGGTYKLKLTVLDPVPMTNEVQVWLANRVYAEWIDKETLDAMQHRK